MGKTSPTIILVVVIIAVYSANPVEGLSRSSTKQSKEISLREVSPMQSSSGKPSERDDLQLQNDTCKNHTCPTSPSPSMRTDEVINISDVLLSNREGGDDGDITTAENDEQTQANVAENTQANEADNETKGEEKKQAEEQNEEQEKATAGKEESENVTEGEQKKETEHETSREDQENVTKGEQTDESENGPKEEKEEGTDVANTDDVKPTSNPNDGDTTVAEQITTHETTPEATTPTTTTPEPEVEEEETDPPASPSTSTTTEEPPEPTTKRQKPKKINRKKTIKPLQAEKHIYDGIIESPIMNCFDAFQTGRRNGIEALKNAFDRLGARDVMTWVLLFKHPVSLFTAGFEYSRCLLGHFVWKIFYVFLKYGNLFPYTDVDNFYVAIPDDQEALVDKARGGIKFLDKLFKN